MADISKIKTPNGTEYNIKDQWSRDQISTAIDTYKTFAVDSLSGVISALDVIDKTLSSRIDDIVAGGVTYIGRTTTELSDGSTTSQIRIDGETDLHTAQTGDLVTYGTSDISATSEFIFNGTRWYELGSTSGVLGKLAYKDNATGTVSITYTPGGTVSQPTFTGSSTTFNGNFTPAGNVTSATTDTTLTVSYTPEGTIGTGTGEANYTPAGDVQLSNLAFSGTYSKVDQVTVKYRKGKLTQTTPTVTATGTFTASGTVTTATTEDKTATVSPAGTGTATYTPAGTVAAPTISVENAGATTTIKNPTAVTVAKTVVAAAPSAATPDNAITYYDVSGETLTLYQLGYTTGDSITTENTTVKTGDAAYTATAPAFTGTGVRLVTGNIAVPNTYTFTGDVNQEITATTTVSAYTLGDADSDTSVTATVSQSDANLTNPTVTGSAKFTGTGVELKFAGSTGTATTNSFKLPTSITFTGTQGSVSVSGTPSGSVSQPTFTGSGATLTAEVTVS